MANIPDYTVGGRGRPHGLHSRVVVGKADDTRTPEFSDVMSYFVVNPTWHIPDSIAQRVYLPKLKTNPNTLANSNIRLLHPLGHRDQPGPRGLPAVHPGELPVPHQAEPVRRQCARPGEVHVSRTSSRSIFTTRRIGIFSRRPSAPSPTAASGCQKPLDLAYLLLQGQVPDPRAAFDGWLAARTERTVQLQRPIPVTLDYRTVFVDDAGSDPAAPRRLRPRCGGVPRAGDRGGDTGPRPRVMVGTEPQRRPP